MLTSTSKFRSRFEEAIAKQLEYYNVGYTYEDTKVPYLPKPKKYITDFVLDNGIIIETKGYFTSADRTKHLLIKMQHPELDIRFVFQNAANKIRKGSRTSYADWCEQHGFQWAEGIIPTAWLREKRR